MSVFLEITIDFAPKPVIQYGAISSHVTKTPEQVRYSIVLCIFENWKKLVELVQRELSDLPCMAAQF